MKSIQIWLDDNEWDSLTAAMRILGLGSTAEALREGLRLLRQEARQVEAANAISACCGGRAVPVPEGVLPVTPADLEAADNVEWQTTEPEADTDLAAGRYTDFDTAEEMMRHFEHIHAEADENSERSSLGRGV